MYKNKISSYFYFVLATITTALSVVFLIKLGELLSNIFSLVNEIYWWAPLVWTPVCTMAVVYLIRRIVPESAGTGSPQALIPTDPRTQSSFVDKFVSVKIAVGKIFFTAGAFMSGLSLGNEGPAVQIGASMMHSFREKIQWIKDVSAQTLVMIGNGIGLAVCFGSVLGGFMYCVERMSNTFNKSNKTMTLMAMLVATAVYTLFLNTDDHRLIFEPQSLTIEILIPALVVIALGLAISTAWSRALIYTMDSATNIAKFKNRRPIIFAGMCGFIVAAIGIAVGGSIIGLSHNYTQSLFDENFSSSYWFAPAKFLASVLTAWSGVSAGMFIPMINIGGGIGASVAQFMSTAFAPTLVAFGMVTFLAAVSRAPICSLFVILDLTGNYQLFIPLLVVSVTASVLSKFLGPDLWQTQTDMLLSKFVPKHDNH